MVINSEAYYVFDVGFSIIISNSNFTFDSKALFSLKEENHRDHSILRSKLVFLKPHFASFC